MDVHSWFRSHGLRPGVQRREGEGQYKIREKGLIMGLYEIMYVKLENCKAV